MCLQILSKKKEILFCPAVYYLPHQEPVTEPRLSLRRLTTAADYTSGLHLELVLSCMWVCKVWGTKIKPGTQRSPNGKGRYLVLNIDPLTTEAGLAVCFVMGWVINTFGFAIIWPQLWLCKHTVVKARKSHQQHAWMCPGLALTPLKAC